MYLIIFNKWVYLKFNPSESEISFKKTFQSVSMCKSVLSSILTNLDTFERMISFLKFNPNKAKTNLEQKCSIRFIPWICLYSI